MADALELLFISLSICHLYSVVKVHTNLIQMVQPRGHMKDAV